MTSHCDDGFRLIEVLVSFTILSAAIILTFATFSEGMHSIAYVNARIEEMEVARLEFQKLTATGIGGPESHAGVTGRVAWRIDVSEMSKPYGDGWQGVRPLLLRVAIISSFNTKSPNIVIETIVISRPKVP